MNSMRKCHAADSTAAADILLKETAIMREAEATEQNALTVMKKKRSNKVVNIQATAQLQVVLVKPEVFTDAKQIADHLIAKKNCCA